MTPKEKATELVDKFKDYVNDFYTDFANQDDLIYNIKSNAKECALIAVDEIINVLNGESFSRNAIVFWTSVKQEIEKL